MVHWLNTATPKASLLSNKTTHHTLVTVADFEVLNVNDVKCDHVIHCIGQMITVYTTLTLISPRPQGWPI